MGSEIVLSAGVRQNLLSLQNTARLMSTTQNRLATGKEVNSAIDNPVNFFTSAGLKNRSRDLGSLLDAMANGIKTIEAADNGVTGIKSVIELMKSTLMQARQDKSFKTNSYPIALATTTGTEVLSFTNGSVGAVPVNVDLTKSQAVLTASNAYANLDFFTNPAYETLNFDVAVNNGTTRNVKVIGVSATTLDVKVDNVVVGTYTVADVNAVTLAQMQTTLNSAFAAAATPVPIAVTTAAGKLVFTATNTPVSSSASTLLVSNITSTGGSLAVGNFGYDGTDALTHTNVTAMTVDEMVTSINGNVNLIDKVQASNDNNTLRISNMSTSDLTVTGITSGTIDGSLGATTIGGNTVRLNLVRQFNDLRDQLNKISDDASYNGVNLLRGDRLKITFNETGTSTIVIQAKDEFGNVRPINTLTLGIDYLLNAEVDSDTLIDTRLDDMADALHIVQAQASNFGSNLSIVQIRTEFTKQMINTLEVGADNLIIADINEESANMLALQTRQQLSTTALSLASQADQSVLRLFG